MGDLLKTLLFMVIWEKDETPAAHSRKLTNLLALVAICGVAWFGLQITHRLDRLEEAQMKIQQEYYRIATIEQTLKGINERMDRQDVWLREFLTPP